MEDEEDIAIQKEEGRVWQKDIQSNDDKNRHCAINSQQKEDTKWKIADEQKIKHKVERHLIVNGDHSRIADKDQWKIEHHQKIVKQVQ